jgi:hypothetical protein
MNVIPAPPYVIPAEAGIQGRLQRESTHNAIPAQAGIQHFITPGSRIESGMTEKFTKMLIVKTKVKKFLLISDCV